MVDAIIAANSRSVDLEVIWRCGVGPDRSGDGAQGDDLSGCGREGERTVSQRTQLPRSVPMKAAKFDIVLRESSRSMFKTV